MKIYEKKIIPAKEYSNCVKRKCDLCGIESNDDDWAGGIYEVNESTISMEITCRTGEVYPDGGFTSHWEVDICPKCFVDKLIPWMNSQGADIQKPEFIDF